MVGRGLLVALVLALLQVGSASAASNEMFGVSVNRVFNDDFRPTHWDAPLEAVHASGIRQARSDAFWMWAEPNPPSEGVHTYDWRQLDAEAGALARHGLRWLPILDYSAQWAASDQGDYHSPPTSNDDYAAYAGAFAARYGRGGSFWLEHPELDPMPVTTYEIWNEPNGAWFWRPAPNAAAYADMYLKARAAIKAVDSDATAVVGGLVGDASYVQAMYAARPELRGNVDAVGWHPYAPTAAGAIGSVRALRLTLEGLGERYVPIHLTEVGWPTSGQGSNIVLGEEDRALALETATEALARSDCGVASVIAYTWTTPERDAGNIEDWYGLRHPDGRPSPSSDAFARVVAHWNAYPVTDAHRFRLCHPPDADGDGTPDAEDRDDDNDGVPDTEDAFPLDRSEQLDTDHDGLGNNADADDDADGVIDVLDAFPLDPLESADSDGDGVGNNVDTDDDNDGLPDTAERRYGSSPTDADTDDDGLPDAVEHRTSAVRADTDGDGLPDGVEAGLRAPLPVAAAGTSGTDLARFRADRDPRTRTSAVRKDGDGDGLSDGTEDRNHNGRRDRGETDPLKADSDRDHVRDRRDRWPLDRRRH
jgi:hypothetical protein